MLAPGGDGSQLVWWVRPSSVTTASWATASVARQLEWSHRCKRGPGGGATGRQARSPAVLLTVAVPPLGSWGPARLLASSKPGTLTQVKGAAGRRGRLRPGGM